MFWYVWNSLEGESGLSGPFEVRSKVEDSVVELVETMGHCQVTCFFIEADDLRPELIDIDINRLSESAIM